MFDTPGSFLAAIRQNKNRRHVPQLFGSVYLSAGGSILVSGVDLSLLSPPVGLAEKIARVIPGRFYFPN